ncbi:MAG: hypothetical protein Q7U71_03500 [bacterium]|nr:hypothetical protein [bacterium]
MKKIILLLSLAAIGCASQVTIKHDLRRTLPVIIDESTTGGQRFGAGFAGKTGSEQKATTEYYYTDAVNATFESYEKSNAYGYLSFTPYPWFSIRAGLDDVGYCGDAIFRISKPMNSAAGFLDLGLTRAASASLTGYANSSPSYYRIGLGGSVAPFSFGSDTCFNKKAARFRVYGSVTLTQYPEWIDFSQSFNDSTGAAIESWTIKTLVKGETNIFTGGLSWEPGIFLFSLGAQRAFQTKEKGVRVDLGSQPPYLVDTNPKSELRYLFKLGFRI